MSAALVLAATVLVLAQTATQPGTHPISGRRFAGVMGYQGADWLDREERDIEEAPERALEALGLKTGQTVADIGAGTGYMTVKMAKRVGPSGRVYAEDVQPEMIELLRQRLARDRVTNVTPVLGLLDDPKLPASTLDSSSCSWTCTTNSQSPRRCSARYGRRSSQEHGSSCSSTERRIRRFRSGRSTR